MGHVETTAESHLRKPLPGDSVLLILGLALYWCMARVFVDTVALGGANPLGVVSAGPASAYPGFAEGGATSPPLFLISLLSTVLATLLMAVADYVGGHVSAWLLRPRALCAFCVGVAGALPSAVVVSASLSEPPALLLNACASVLGIAAAVLTLGWGALMSALPSRAVYVVVPCAFLLSCVFQQIKTVLPPVAVLIADACIPAIAAFLWWLAARTSAQRMTSGGVVRAPLGEGLRTPSGESLRTLSGEGLRTPKARTAVYGRLSTRALACVGVVFFFCSLAGELLESLAGTALSTAIEPYSGLGMLFVAALLALAVPLVSRASGIRAVLGLWVAFVLVLLGTFIIMPVIGDAGLRVAAIAIVAEKKCLVVLVWVFLATVSPRSGLPLFAAFGLGHLALHSLPSLIGRSAGAAIGVLSPQVPPDIDVLAVAMAFVIMCALALALYGGAGEDTGLHEPHATLVEVSGLELTLSQREAQIVELLVSGNSYPAISSKLGISLSTVRTHAQKIYRKLGVHSKQDLVDLVGQGGTGR